jgi:hypothetical protein
MSAIHTPCTVCHPVVIRKSPKKRWIPADLVQNTAEYSGSVASLVSFRGVSSMWQDAVSDAVGFLNGRCWTQLKKGRDNPLWRSFRFDRPTVVARCALLCLGRRLETLTWRYVADELDFPLRLLVENNTVLTTLTLDEDRYYERTVDVSRLQSCRALKQLDLTGCNVADDGIRGLELIPTLEVLDLGSCEQITDVSCLRSCRALKTLVLSFTNVTDAGMRSLELIPTLEVLNLEGCEQITDVSRLQSCRALKQLVLFYTNVTDVGIRGLELILTLEELNLSSCTKVHDLSALRNRPGLRIVAPKNTTTLPL